MNHRNVKATLPLTIRLLTIRAPRDRFITILAYLSEPVLLRSCTVALFHWYRCRWCQTSLLPRIYIQEYPYPLILPTPPLLLQLLSSSFLLLQLFSSRPLLPSASSASDTLINPTSYLLYLALVVRQSFNYFFPIVLYILAGRNDLNTNS